MERKIKLKITNYIIRNFVTNNSVNEKTKLQINLKSIKLIKV